MGIGCAKCSRPSLKKIPETDAIFANIKARDAQAGAQTKRLSMDCKATVCIGEYCRGGQTRGDRHAVDHDMGCQEKYTPLGIVDEDSGHLYLSFGSSAKTSDFIVDGLQHWWRTLSAQEQEKTDCLQIKIDNGPESSGVRTQFLKRMTALSNQIGKPLHLLYYPPYHSKYNPIERCWGILELHWNGAKLIDAQTMLAWAQSMTWKGVPPIVSLNSQNYRKGVSVSKKQMREIEGQLERNPLLPKWDILIRPQQPVDSLV